MSLDITGKVVQIGARQSGEGRNGPWVKQDLILETEEQYPRKICLVCWGERADEANAFSPGQRIKAFINIESREFNGKWYTDVKPWRFERMDEASAASDKATPYTDDGMQEVPPEDDLPF